MSSQISVILSTYKNIKLEKRGFIISKTPRFINAESQHKSEYFTCYSGKVMKTTAKYNKDIAM